ncbi:MAG: 6-pyruvoyl tetrahydropterin synthase family protein [Flavobacteriales bacterium]|nr:6-pyruvoyl tetrahydropterin synthase family protein [Flavobacteriales bacterium]
MRRTDPARRVRVTKRFTFEMAHALTGHDGACAGLHGHSYALDVTLSGAPRNMAGHPKDGMVMDFAELKHIVKRTVLDRYDHVLVLHENERGNTVPDTALFGRTVFVPWQPTCENLVGHRGKSPVHTSRCGGPSCGPLAETATSWAEWEYGL